MAEVRTIAGSEKIKYSGLFSLKELYALVNEILEDRGYDPIEVSVEETVEKTGKCVEANLEPSKKFTDYAKSIIKIKIRTSDCTEVEVKKGKKKQKLNKGKLLIEVDPLLETDYEHRWEMSPYLYVFRTLFEKYIYTPFLSKFDKQIQEDVEFIKDQIKSFLNLQKLK
jgi:hypothetical protein